MNRRIISARQLWRLMTWAILFAALAAPAAHAATGDTLAGTPISNQAIINYEVGGVAQNPVSSDDPDVAGVQATTFLVDRKVRVVVGLSGGDVVTPGTQGYITYTVLNDNNSAAALDILLSYQAGADGTEDDFDMGSVAVYWDNDGNGTYDGSEPGGPTHTISLARDATATVFIVATAPLNAENGWQSLYHLIATAQVAGDTDGDDPTVAEVVYSDGAGSVPAPAGPDVARDGRHSISGVFDVDSAALAAEKTSTVISDPFGGAYRIPGAVVAYTLSVDNTGPVDATAVVIIDRIPDDTTFAGGFTASNSNAGVVPVLEYATVTSGTPGATDWSASPPADPADVTWVRTTHSVVDATSGEAGMVFRVTID